MQLLAGHIIYLHTSLRSTLYVCMLNLYKIVIVRETFSISFFTERFKYINRNQLLSSTSIKMYCTVLLNTFLNLDPDNFNELLNKSYF